MIKEKLLKKIEKQIFEEKSSVLETGFYSLDSVLSGVEIGSLITIGARPSMGRTCFMISIMLNLLKNNKKCLYFSLEMSVEKLIKRLLVQISEIDAQIINGNEKEKLQNNSEKIYETLEQIKKFDLTIFDNSTDINTIKEKIENDKPNFVFIDSLEMIKIPAEKTRCECFSNIMTDLKQIAKDNECIIFIKSGLSRKVENRPDKRPILEDLRESDAIENLSDVVLFIYRDNYANSNNYCTSDDSHITEIIIAKNKNGSVGMVSIIFKKKILKFDESFLNCKF